MRQITAIQTAAILISTIIGVGVLAHPRLAVLAADTGAPIVTVLGALLGIAGLSLVTILGVRFPQKSIAQYSEMILGKWISHLASFCIILFFAELTALASREFGEVVVTSVLKQTPIEVTVIVMLLLAAMIARKDIRTFAYVHLFYLPFIILPGLVIVTLSLKNARVLNLLPVWGAGPDGVFSGILTIATLFQGSFIMTLVIPFMRQPRKAYISAFWGWLIAGGFYVLIVIATVAVFGTEEIKLMLWPTLELAKATSLPANILERLDAAFLAVWVTAVFTTLFSSYYLTMKTMTQLLHLRDHQMFSYFILPFIFLLAMLPQSVLQLYEIIEIVGRIGLIITIGYPSLLLAIALIRKQRGEPNAGSEES
ncbi:spore germination protein [Paenibacillus sp. sptzw28]|uniref:GerAB/ArcD/ProY family transporter n=1 Tax=Paenibacillus sp. sptzw28 TaxID=715179 RepID=UPI001C6EED4E|nr:endospore germination permease [Paenibacillus sp. sptzw28]QYR24147.1 spore germination protein [Paenibacillus sp. sptzw28]